jgi:hypothetical protein
VSVLAEGGRKVGGGTLLFDEVIRPPNARTVTLVLRLPSEDEKYAPLSVDKGLWVTVQELGSVRKQRRGIELQSVPGDELEAHADEFSKAATLLATTLLRCVLDFCSIRAMSGRQGGRVESGKVEWLSGRDVFAERSWAGNVSVCLDPTSVFESAASVGAV